MRKKTVNIVMICFSFVLFTSCCKDVKYQYSVTHLNGEVDTIFIYDNNPRMSRDNYAEVVSECDCETYAVDVKRFKAIGTVPLSKEELDAKKQRVKSMLVTIGSAMLFTIILIMFLRRPRYDSYSQVKNKSSTMKKILMYVIYAGGIVITFKVVLLLIKYLPTIIESYLK